MIDRGSFSMSRNLDLWRIELCKGERFSDAKNTEVINRLHKLLDSIAIWVFFCDEKMASQDIPPDINVMVQKYENILCIEQSLLTKHTTCSVKRPIN